MAFSNVIFSALDYVASGDLSQEQYTFVKRGAGNEIFQANAGEAALGVLWNDPAAQGRAATVVVGGRPNVYVGTGGVTKGAEIASDNEGQAVAAVATDVVLGYATHTAAAGELVQVEFLSPAQFTKA